MTEDRAMRLDLPYLMRVRNRKGGWRYYVRRDGKLTRIHGAPGTPAFLRSYEAALGDTSPSKAPTSPTNPKTWRWLCAAYMASPEWGELATATRAQRQRVMESTWLEPIAPGSPDTMGECPLAAFGARHVRVLRDRKRDHPEAANHRLKLIRSVIAWGIEAEQYAGPNPARDVASLRPRNRDGHHTWTIEEIERYRRRHTIGTKARLALELLLFTGARRSDLVRLGRPMLQEGRLRWTVAKTRQPIEIPMLPELRAVLDATPLVGVGTWLVTQYGRPFTVAGFGNWFRDRCNEAGLPHCTAHGLRKAGATIAAENGATEHELMAIFGWETAKQVGTYTRKARRGKLAAGAMRLMVSKE